jgi:hypothetical protein
VKEERRSRGNYVQNGLQREVEVMARQETQIQSELDSSGRKLHKQAKVIEERWRKAHGIDDKLQSKRQQKARHKRQQRHGEVRRREERRQQRRSLLRQPALVAGGGGDDGPRLIRQAPRSGEADGPVYYGTPPFAISRCPEDRQPPKPGSFVVYVQIQEVQR